MKGSVVISETLLELVGIIISFILIVLVVQLVFQTQTQTTYQSAFESVARDISTAIDRAAASSGSLYIQEDLPKGLSVNVSIDYKTVIVSSQGTSVRKSFSGLTNTPPVFYVNPSSLCIVKTQNDNRVSITSGICQCNPNDNKCDPACAAQGICDKACMNSTLGVCNPYCSQKYSNTCDTNCYQNFTTGVCESACINPNATTGVCSPDCNNVKKGVCSLDCYQQYSNGKTGNCDPDCPSELPNLIKIGNLTVKPSDGNCYTGCVNTSMAIQTGLPISTAPCDPANNTNWHCLVFSNTSDYTSQNYTDYTNQIWSCGGLYTKCAGQLCQDNTTKVNGMWVGGNILCHVKYVDPQMFPQTPVCCCVGSVCQSTTRQDCLTHIGDIYNASDSRCQQNQIVQTQKITLVSDGVCDQDCNATANICDPDCPNSPACQNICISEGQKANGQPCCSGLMRCPGTDVCSKSCCGNGVCESASMWQPGNKTLWETPYTCPQDCGNATEPSCAPGGPFTQSACYNDIMNQDGTITGEAPTWSGNAIQICSQDAKLFLDRRNWDINQVLATVKALPPLGWAFDASRYVDACSRIQPASLTISANENYTSSYPICCSIDGAGCNNPDAVFLGQQCAGVGFCADQAAAMLSILRTLGVPDYDVFMTFMLEGQNCGRHAFVVMKCDPSLPANMFPNECQGHNGEWLRIDATQHFVSLLKDSPCISMAIWWNDKGIYPLTYGALPDLPNGQKQGYVFPTDATCNTAGEPTESYCASTFNVEHHYDLLCQPFNVQCVVP